MKKKLLYPSAFFDSVTLKNLIIVKQFQINQDHLILKDGELILGKGGVHKIELTGGRTVIDTEMSKIMFSPLFWRWHYVHSVDMASRQRDETVLYTHGLWSIPLDNRQETFPKPTSQMILYRLRTFIYAYMHTPVILLITNIEIDVLLFSSSKCIHMIVCVCMQMYVCMYVSVPHVHVCITGVLVCMCFYMTLCICMWLHTVM